MGIVIWFFYTLGYFALSLFIGATALQIGLGFVIFAVASYLSQPIIKKRYLDGTKYIDSYDYPTANKLESRLHNIAYLVSIACSLLVIKLLNF